MHTSQIDFEMIFGLLGDDASAVPLLRAIAENPEHRLSVAVAADGIQMEHGNWLGPVHFQAAWPELLDCDAVIVCGAEANVLEDARRLAVEGAPLWVVPHSGQDAGWVYELALIRDDSGSLIVPAFFLRNHPAVAALREMRRTGRFGELLHVEIERTVAVDGRLLSKAEIDTELIRDADLIRMTFGSMDRVLAVTSGDVEGRFSTSTVTLAGEETPTVLWSIRARRGDDDRDCRIRVVGAAGETVVWLAADGADWQWSPPGDETDRRFDPGPAALEQFESAFFERSREPNLSDLTRAVEVADAARRSLRRGRAIELFEETASERNQFKSQMTAIGCSVMLLTLVLLLGLLVVGPLLPKLALQILRIAIFLPLFLFLICQSLLWIAKPSQAKMLQSVPAEGEKSRPTETPPIG